VAKVASIYISTYIHLVKDLAGTAEPWPQNGFFLVAAERDRGVRPTSQAKPPGEE
jgi:hypothetical protein